MRGGRRRRGRHGALAGLFSAAVLVTLATTPDAHASSPVPGCAEAPPGVLEVAPADADWVVELDASVFRASTWDAVGGVVGLDRDGARWLAAWDRCLAAGSPESVSVAGNDAGWAWVVRGRAAATDTAIACVTRWLSGSAHEPLTWTRGPSYAGECVRSSHRSDGLVAYALENRTLVISSSAWAEPLRAGLLGERGRARDLAAGVRMVEADPAGRVFAAGTMHRPNVAYDGDGGWTATVRNVAVTIRVSDAGVAARADVETTDLADSLLAAFTTSAPELYDRLARLGMHADLIERIAVNRRAGVLSWAWYATRAELGALVRDIGPRWRGGAL